MTDASDFISKNKLTLSKIDVSYFFTCLTLSKQNKRTKEQANNYANTLVKLEPIIKVKSIGQFPGVLSCKDMSFVAKLIFKSGFALLGLKEGDYRNWNAIKIWVNKHNETS